LSANTALAVASHPSSATRMYDVAAAKASAGELFGTPERSRRSGTTSARRSSVAPRRAAMLPSPRARRRHRRSLRPMRRRKNAEAAQLRGRALTRPSTPTTCPRRWPTSRTARSSRTVSS